MKFRGQDFQELEHEQQRQTDDRTYYHSRIRGR